MNDARDRSNPANPDAPQNGVDGGSAEPSSPDAPTRAAGSQDTHGEPLPDLGPKFEVLGRIGQGSMGSVYRVRHRDLDHVRAVKVIVGSGTEQQVQRLRQEASIATDLAHPNIVTVYDLEQLPGGGLGIVMEYLEGHNLVSVIKQRGPLDVEELLGLFEGAADALDQMHANGVIHRDLKPANLFLCDDGTLKILDFGISRHLIQDDALTQTGTAPGTPPFMAPEQFAGAELSGRTDVYALGAVLYLCLTGRMPISGTYPAEVVAAAMYRVPPGADAIRSDLPRHVASALARALEKKPERRQATASQLLAEAAGQAPDSTASEERTPAEPPSADSRSEPSPPQPALHEKGLLGRRPMLLLLTLAAVLVLGLVTLNRYRDRASGAARTSHVAGRSATPREAEPPVRGGVLRAGACTALPSIDPLVSDVSEGQMAVCRLVFDTLVTLDWTGEVQPLLATGWTVQDEQRTFVFQLRRDARFHDDPCFEGGQGRLLDAGDVKATLERVLLHIAGTEGHPLAHMPRVLGTDERLAGTAGHIAGISTPDDHTVVVRFERPSTDFLHVLSWLPWSITAREALLQYGGDGDLGYRGVGTGPYRVLHEESGAGLVLVPHDGAWQRDPADRQLPFPERLEVHAYPGPIAAATSMKEGRIDLLMGANNDIVEEFFAVEGDKATPRPEWEGYQAGGYLDDAMREQRVMMLDARSTSPALADTRIRRAISLAIRRDEIAPDDSYPTNSPLVDSMLGYQPRVGADPEQARALLHEAGYPGDGTMPLLTICGTASFHDAMSAIHDHLGEVGIASTVIAVEPRGMYRYFTDGGCDALMLTMMGLVVDGDLLEYLISYASMVQLDQRSEELDGLVERARDEGDRGRRAEFVIELAKMLEEDAMLVVLAQRRAGIPDYAYIASPRVGGLNDARTGLMNPLRERLHQLWVRPDEP